MSIPATSQISPNVSGALQKASQATGTGFEYLLKTALVESNLNPSLKASTSSATGLFQFIDQTWLGTLKEAGPSLGYGNYAQAISKTASGRYVVTDPSMQDAVMRLRNDPTANATMAGAFTKSNAARLANRIGRTATDSELYMAHFLGAGGAAKLITAAGNTPGAKGSELFPAAAAANRSIFFDQQGRARTASEVYQVLSTRYANAGGKLPAQPAVAATTVPQAAPVASVIPANPATMVTAMAPAEPVTAGRAVASFNDRHYFPSTQVSFHSLFSTEDRGALSPRVAELWSGKAVQ